MDDLKATVIIITYNQEELLPICLSMLKRADGVNNIIIVDNGSQDETDEWLKAQSYEHVIFDEKRQSYGKVLNIVLNKFKTEEYLLVLNPRYLCGRKTVKNMIETAQRNSKSGLIGAISNGFFPMQYCDIKGPSDLYQLEEQEINVKKDFSVIGFKEELCLIRKSSICEGGAFEEEIFCPESVMIDYSLKLLEKGYQHIVCSDAYVYDSLSRGWVDNDIDKIKTYDYERLKKKWNINYFNFMSNHCLTNLIDRSRDEIFSVLEVGCDLGANLLEIRENFPNCKVYGLEINQSAVNIAKNVADVRIGDIETYQIPFEEKFDYIIFGDVLEHLHNPQETIRYCWEELVDNGCIIASIPNIMHISVMEQLINGRFEYENSGLLDRTHIHFFTYYEIVRMFEEEKYKIDKVLNTFQYENEAQRNLKEQLLGLSNQTKAFMYETFQYQIRGRKNRS